jgi:CDP-diacylglycerol--glycerol-3-phosphate 3-phosphatidyltransferase
MVASGLSFLRFILALITFYEIVEGKFKTALVLTIIAALTDFFDGWIARKFNQKTEIGAHLDHIGDKVFVLTTLVAFYLKNTVGILPLSLLLVREIGITVLRFQGLASPVNHLGKLKTTLEFLSLVLLCIEPKLGNIVLWIAVFAAYLSAYFYINRPITAK